MTTTTPRADLHPALDVPLLRDLVHPDRELWTPRELRELTSTVANELTTPLLEILRYDRERRWWARLGLTGGVELWLLSWLPGQGTEPHDHGGAAGSFTVLTGELSEEYRYPGGPVRDATRPVGSALGFGAGRAHRVLNRGMIGAASVHAYSPPLVPTREYPSLLDIPDEIPPLPARRLPLEQLRELADQEGP
ncbi:cysteine dioxygenase [Saccharothrix yanglingensis]|uniref:Cysteine dioxygenase n=1 Tax=Saccharothrix yanglingensis TaxID=659496 RepID=A0ABU0X1Y3_9PSEU|nr:cysteine dioxygenase family protein [Saccharothrix yanglingensis]MDQ2586130.1 cysteine dioxygenase [Saccharothrix yanglingensis]